jgi:hypothetical protein
MEVPVHLIVVRHSERLDEVDEGAWKKMLAKSSGRKTAKDDPVISPERGERFALDMAKTLKEILPRMAPDVRPVLYSSKLLRAVQTAAFVAKELNLPVRLSAGLATIIPAVKKAAGSFEFASIDEMRSLCPGVEFIDCDQQGGNFVPPSHWKDATASIVETHVNELPIIIAHRESVRKLAGEFKQTPYCCLGLFNLEGRGHSIFEGKKSSDGDHAEAGQGGELDSKPHATAIEAADGHERPFRKCGTADPPLDKARMHKPSDHSAGSAAAGSEARPMRKCGTADPGPGAAGAAAIMKERHHTGPAAGHQATKASADAKDILSHLRLISILDRDGEVVDQDT